MVNRPLQSKSLTVEEIGVCVAGAATLIGEVLPVITFWWRFTFAVIFVILAADICLRSRRARSYFPSHYRRLTLSLCVLIAITTVLWNPLREQYAKEHPLPSIVYVTGGPFGDDSSPVWLMSFKHFGPSSAFNCHGEFVDLQQDGPESEFHRTHRTDSIYQFSFPEVDPVPGFGDNNFNWVARDPNNQHYHVNILCRDGQFVEDFTIKRIDGAFQVRLDILQEEGSGTERVERKVFGCDDSFVPSRSLLPPVLNYISPYFYPYWQPHHRYSMGVIIQPPPPGAIPPPDAEQPPLPFPLEVSPCWLLFNGPKQHIGNLELPLSFSGFQWVVIAYGTVILILPLYIFLALWRMGVTFSI